MAKTKVQGIGINDADYETSSYLITKHGNGRRSLKLVWRCPYYRKWEQILNRCYSKNYLSRRPTYLRVLVCDEWLLFSNFKSWMEQQDWEGKVLDKDFLSEDTKIYSPNTCVFIDKELNGFILDSKAARGKYKQGVDFHKTTKKFRSRCGNQYLGLYDTEDEAHEAWRMEKKRQATEWANKVEDPRLKTKLLSMYENVS